MKHLSKRRKTRKLKYMKKGSTKKRIRQSSRKYRTIYGGMDAEGEGEGKERGEDFNSKLEEVKQKQQEIFGFYNKIKENLKKPISVPSLGKIDESIYLQLENAISSPNEEQLNQILAMVHRNNIEIVLIKATDPVKYWLKYFNQDELLRLKQKLNNIDNCGIIQQLIPIYFKSEMAYNINDPSIQKYFCIVFIVIGILTYKLQNVCEVILKGGKAIQMITAGTGIQHKSNDIDILIYPRDIKLDISHNIALRIAEFITWINSNLIYKDFQRETASIVKISLNSSSLTTPIMSPISSPIPSPIVGLSGRSTPAFGQKIAISDINYSIDYSPIHLLNRVIKHPISLTNYGINEIMMFMYFDADVQVKDFIYHMLSIDYENKLNKSLEKDVYFINKSINSVNVLLDYLVKTTGSNKNNIIDKYCYEMYALWSTYPNTNITVLRDALDDIKNKIKNPIQSPIQSPIPRYSSRERLTPLAPRIRTPLAIVDKKQAELQTFSESPPPVSSSIIRPIPRTPPASPSR